MINIKSSTHTYLHIAHNDDKYIQLDNLIHKLYKDVINNESEGVCAYLKLMLADLEGLQEL